MSSVPPSPSLNSLQTNRPVRWLLVYLCSLAAMSPWPLLAILLTYSSFDTTGEVALLFGGITSIFLVIPMLLFGSVPEASLAIIIYVVWVLALLLPPLIPLLTRRMRSPYALLVLFAMQSAFSLAQAALGAFMIFGKDV